MNINATTPYSQSFQARIRIKNPILKECACTTAYSGVGILATGTVISNLASVPSTIPDYGCAMLSGITSAIPSMMSGFDIVDDCFNGKKEGKKLPT